MSTSAIINRIHNESSLEVSEILRLAQEECEQILNAGQQKAYQEYSRIVRAGERASDQEIREMQSRIRIEARNRVRIAREMLIARSFEEAARHLQKIRSHPSYPEIFSRLCEEGRVILETRTIIVSVDPRDRLLADAIASVYSSQGIMMTFAELNYATSGGMIVTRSDGAYVDNTLEARLEREKRDLLIEIAGILFQKDFNE
jgi:vacuolar-type H+-ATPase subunit E/Vma4